MKNKAFLTFFCFSLFAFVSCRQEPILEGFHFDEEAFINAKQEWKDANVKDYSFDYFMGFGGFDAENVRSFKDIIRGTVTMENGIPYEKYYCINATVYEDNYTSGGYYIPAVIDEEAKRLEEEYNITSCAILTVEDFIRFVEERVEVAKNRYANGRCTYYKATVEFMNFGFSFRKIFTESYCFIPNKKTNLQQTRVVIDNLKVSP